jgi:hypothetical protein
MKLVNKITILLASACLTLSSCDVDPVLTSSYPDETVWTNETNLQLYINGFYSLIGGYYGSAVYEDACSDILKANDPIDEQNLFVFGSTPITTVSNLFGDWGNRHTWQLLCCRFLDGLKEHRANFTEDVANRAEAEIRFFRAVANFDLAKRYGASFILYKKLPQLGEKEHARCNPDSCWDFIAEDLDFAAKNLPLRGSSGLADGKLTSGAAYGMKARAMLYAQRWKAASDAAAELEKQGYELYSNYGELFTNRRSKVVENKESVIEFGYLYQTMDYSFDYFYCPPSDGGYAEISPTEDLASAYQMADGRDFNWNDPQMAANPYEGREPRFYASLLYNGCKWKGSTLYTYEGSADGYAVGGGTTCTGYYMRKLFDPEISKSRIRNTDLTYYYMRYAEVLLIYAEAMAMQDGHLTEALAALNKVRRRAGLPDVTASTRTEFMKLLRHERMVELAFEGHRFWDLRRWGLATTVLNNTHMKGVKPTQVGNGFKYEVVDCDGGKTRVYLEKYNRFPIPLSEIQQNHACEQFDEWK